jgi:hypothetical protein
MIWPKSIDEVGACDQLGVNLDGLQVLGRGQIGEHCRKKTLHFLAITPFHPEGMW